MAENPEDLIVTDAELRRQLPALAEELNLGGSGGSGIEQVSGTVTLDDSGDPIREFFTTGATTFKANGADTLLSSFTAVVWRRTAQGVWGYQIVQDEWTTPAPTPDTTAPVAGTLAVTVTDVKADLSVSGASDDRGIQSYEWSKDGGATWPAQTTGPTYSFTGLTASTAYQFRHRVKDAAGNTAVGTVVTKTTLAVITDTTAPVAGTLSVSVTESRANLVVSGASDDRGPVSYAFSKDDGANWTAYQDSATYTFAGLAEQTTYTFKHRVKDAAGNPAVGAGVTKTTTTLPTFTTLSAAIKHMAPVGYWKLDEAGGTQATDSSGNNRHGTYSGAVTLNAQNGAPMFAGGHVEIPDAADFSAAGSAAGFTMFAIARPDVIGSRQFVVTKGVTNAYEWGLEFKLAGSAQVSEVALMDPSGKSIAYSQASGVTAGAWNALCTTIGTPGAGATWTMYRNSGTPTGSVGTQPVGVWGAEKDTTAPVRIAQRGDNVGAFKGSIRHVALFRGKLTDAQVAALMNAARTEGMIA